MLTSTLQLYAALGSPNEANGFAGIGTAEFARMLTGAEASGVRSAQLRINSGGGSWLDAQGIYAMLKASPLQIDTYNDGLAASAASLVLQAGNKRYMSSHARLMLDNCASSTFGQIDDIKKAIELHKAFDNILATVHAERSGQSVERIRKMMNAATWLSADEALALGFIDVVVRNNTAASGAQATMLPLSAAGVMAEIHFRG